MVTAEAPFNRAPILRGERRWTAREGAKMLAQLQGQTVNLLPVLQSRIMPDHAHYGQGWYKDQQEPASLRSSFQNFLSTANKNKVAILYGGYFRQNGVEGNVAVDSFSSSRRLQLTIYPNEQVWPPEIAITLFPMLDFRVDFAISNAALRQIGVGRSAFYAHTRSINVNTTRLEGNLYEIDIPNGSNLKDEETLKNHLGLKMVSASSDAAITLLHTGQIFDVFSISKNGQATVTALLAARV